MATLTSTGAVNLTSSTNWSPAQIPQDGDDLVIGAATLTLDADMTLNSITFNNASSRLAIGGTSRSVTATNGFILAASLSAQLITSAIPVGTSLTLTGRWSGQFSLLVLCSSTGGNLTLQTVGSDPSAVLFSDVLSSTHSRIITASWTGGTLTTIGRFDLPSWPATNTIVTMSGGTWNHTNTGTSLLGSGSHQLLSASGAITLNWSGDLVSGCTSSSTLFSASSGVSTFNFLNSSIIKRTGGGSGTNHQAGTWPSIVSVAAAANGTVININGILCSSKTSRAISFSLAGSSSSSRVNWRNQSRSISSTDAVVIIASNNHVVDMTDLVLNNAGMFTYIESGSASTVVSAGTLITNTTTSAQASVFSASGALDGKVINLASDAPTLPTVSQVAGGTVYGYSASPLTGTGVISDPAVIAAAVGTALALYETNGVASQNDLQAILDKLPISERAAGASAVTAIKSVTDTMPDQSKVLISTNSQREVAVTGSHHIAADIHECQPDGLINSNQINGIKAKTDNLPSDPADQSAVESAITNASNAITSLINALNDISAADVNAEILDVLQIDTFSELTGPPAANSSLKDKITYLFMWARNKATQTSSERKLYADNGTTVVSTESVSDDNTTFIKNKAQ